MGLLPECQILTPTIVRFTSSGFWVIVSKNFSFILLFQKKNQIIKLQPNRFNLIFTTIENHSKIKTGNNLLNRN
jgi:hypothetical protein